MRPRLNGQRQSIGDCGQAPARRSSAPKRRGISSLGQRAALSIEWWATASAAVSQGALTVLPRVACTERRARTLMVWHAAGVREEALQQEELGQELTILDTNRTGCVGLVQHHRCQELEARVDGERRIARRSSRCQLLWAQGSEH